jgi:hypothetical protein
LIPEILLMPVHLLTLVGTMVEVLTAAGTVVVITK